MDPTFEPASRDDPEVRALFDSFIREADGPLGIDLEAEIAAGPPAELAGPSGVLLLVRVEGEPAGLGGVRHLDTDVAEVKTMYLSPTHRGRGLARALLAELEGIARSHGCKATRLDTSDYLTEAIGLGRVCDVLDHLARTYGEDRYRASWLLRRKAIAKQTFHG